MDRDQVVAGRHQGRFGVCDLGEEDPQPTARAIARHRRTDLSADREGESWGRGAISMKRDPQGTSPAPGAVASQRVERAAATDGRDQADSFCLPLRRRALTMERPARSDMRLRKPCFFARRRLFGWYVRFTLRFLLVDRSPWWTRRGGSRLRLGAGRTGDPAGVSRLSAPTLDLTRAQPASFHKRTSSG